MKSTKLITWTLMILLLSIVVVAGDPYLIDENMQLEENGIFNASTINSTKFYQNGNAVLDSTTPVNSTNYANVSTYWDGETSQADLNVNSTTWWADISGWSSTMFASVSNSIEVSSSWLNSTINSLIGIAEPTLDVNSADYWDSLDTPADINAGDITDDGTYIPSTEEGDLNTNSSNYWDSLDSPSDINAADITNDGTYTLLAGDTMTGKLTIDDDLNVTNTAYIFGNIILGNGSGKSYESYFASEGDYYSDGAMMIQDAFFSFAEAYGTNVALMEHDDIIEITSVGGTATLTAATQILCDTTDPFTIDDVGNFINIIDSVPSYARATGEIIDFINSSCVVISFGSAGSDTIVDATDMTYIVYPAPTFTVLDNGYIYASIGENADAEFKIMIENGTGSYGVHIVDNAGGNDHKALVIDQDIKNLDGTSSINLFTDSSTGTSGINYQQLDQEIRLGGINNSEINFISFNVIGEGNNNDVDVIHITGDVDHVIHQGSVDALTNAYVESVDQTVNFNTNGAGATLFDNVNEYVYVGSNVNFTSIAFALDTQSNKDLSLEYYYCDNTETWQVLPSVTDTTNGMQISGVITFISPSDRGVCNKEYDGTAFGNTTKTAYIAIKRTQASVQVEPIESLVTVGGSSTLMFLQEDMMKLAGSNGPPETCTANFAGAWYYDSSGVQLLWCDGTNWVIFATTAAPVTTHNTLSGLDGGTAGQYYHLTSAQHTIVTQAASTTLSGYLSTGDWNTFNNKADTDTTYTADSPVNLSGTEFGLIACGDGELLQYNATTVEWECEAVAGTGTVTSVGSGIGLTGGPITSSGSLSLNTTYTDTLYATIASLGSYLTLDRAVTDFYNKTETVALGYITATALEPYLTLARSVTDYYNKTEILDFGYLSMARATTDFYNKTEITDTLTSYLTLSRATTDFYNKTEVVALGYIADVVDDTTPDLGGNLTTNGHDIRIDSGDMMGFVDGTNACIFFNGTSIIINNNATGVMCP